MNELTITRGYVYSSLGTDPDLNELVELFVRELPKRVAKLQEAWETQDWDTLGRATHQLTGAVGSYGFEELTPYLQRLDHFVRAKSLEDEIAKALAEVVESCLRARAGSPE